jgi:phenylalanyl-tRNA synthetase beta chain
MQFSESWLRTLVNPPLSSGELSHLLTMAGLEVEEMTPVAPAFEKVVVAQVLSKEKHPDADRLNVLAVDVGQAEPLTIVCGAQNVTVGMKAPCALVGAKLPGIEIKQAKVRGIASFGMMCSDKELGLSDESDGLLELSAEAVVGQNIREHLDLDDHLITLKLTPNRSDCLSVHGIAREVAALTNAPLQPIPAAVFAQTGSMTRKVQVSAPAACPRYMGRVISGVNAKAATPPWMVKRLERCGLRSISALVDVTNYVLLELGQPLHAFDLDKLSGDVEVRFAMDGEQLTLLNEQKVALQGDMLVIADGKGPVALAGVMGGMDSAVDEATKDIFLESAFFVPGVIVGKSRRLGFSSDSSYRFERGVDYSATDRALDRATQLILEICGGEAGAVSVVQSDLPLRPPVLLRSSRILRVLGISLGSDEIAQILTSLGMSFQQKGDDFTVTPPSYRFDIAIEEDLVEEVARVHGYERIQPAPIRASMSMLPDFEAERPLSRIRQVMVLRDYQETINYSFVEAEWERDLCGNTAPVALMNPIASQMSVMRSSLLGGLLGALRTNLARKQSRVRLFEIGGCFKAEAGIYLQEDRLACLAYGAVLPEQWGAVARNVDLFDLKSDLEALFAPRTLTVRAAEHPASHPGRSARILLDGLAIGWLGELHPKWQQQYDMPLPAVWCEVQLSALLPSAVPGIEDISKFPAVRRDIAVLVDEKVDVQSILDTLSSQNAPYVTELALFDVYRGAGVEEGKKSLAFRVLLKDTQKTLTDSEIEPSIAMLVEALHKIGAKLRGK